MASSDLSDGDLSSSGEPEMDDSPQSTKPKQSEWDSPWIEQRQCFLLLLKARMLFRKLLEVRMYEERLTKGALSASEVNDLVRTQGEDPNSDFVRQITELKRNLMSEVKKNHALEKEVTTLDKKIGLLIHNASMVHEMVQKSKKKSGATTASSAIPVEKLKTFSHLFYMLQSEPKYLARLVGAMADQDGIEPLLDTILITLYGDAFSPREEYLILTFFKLTVEQELKQLQSPSAFGPDSILAKAVLSYNHRKQGQEYLRSTLGPILLAFTSQVRKLRLDGKKIHEELINDWEVKHGEKSTKRQLNDDEIAAQPEVAEVIKAKVAEISAACQEFLEAILRTTQAIPYGLRYICRQLTMLARERFPAAKPEEIYRMSSYLVFYRFINRAIVQPQDFQIQIKNSDPVTTMSLVEIAKVLQKLFLFSQFDKRADKWNLPLNDWIAAHQHLIPKYLDEIVSVDNPEDVLQVDQYVELTQMVKPTIFITIGELCSMHRFVDRSLPDLGIAADDKLHILMKELGKPEDYTDEDRDISLVLENRFPQAVEERVTEGNQLFVQTKTMLISVLRQLPQTLKIVSSGAQGDPMLTDILKAGHKWAEEENNESIKEKIRIVLANIAELEKAGVVSSDDGHRTLLRAITLEIANRAQIREQQNKELARLHLALNTAVKQQKFLTEQYSQYMQYIQVVKSRPYTTTKKKRPPRAAKPSASQPEQKLLGPFKFSYSELVRKHVIAESTIPDLVRRAMKLFVTSSEPGIFDIEVKIPAVESAKLRIDIDDLLEQQSRHQEHMTHQIEQASLTLDVNMTIHFLNSLLTKK